MTAPLSVCALCSEQHGKRVRELEAEVARLRALGTRVAAALLLMLHDAHPTYGSTAGWRGGIGGQAITTGCNVIDPPPGGEWAAYDLPSGPLREWLAEHPCDIRAEADALKAELLAALRPTTTTTREDG